MRTLTGRAGDDTGVVAVVVAILVSAVLLIVGALTVDLGSVWAARVGLQGVADAAARAGAALLPQDSDLTSEEQAQVETDVVDAAVRVVCADGNRRPGWGATAEDCRAGSWATDAAPDGTTRDLTNGDVDIVRADPAAYGLDPTDTADTPLLVVVRTPPVHVTFGLARASGRSGTDVARQASARRGLTHPAGSPVAFSPYYLTLDDLAGAHGVTDGATCLRTVAAPPVPDAPRPPPGGSPGYVFGTWVTDGATGAVVGDTDDDGMPNVPDVLGGQEFSVVGARFGRATTVTPSALRVYVGARDAVHQATVTDFGRDPDGTWHLTFRLPNLSAAPYAGRVPVWWVFRTGRRARTSQPGPLVALQYPLVPAVPGDCDRVRTGRGLVDTGRLDGQPLGDAVNNGTTTGFAPFGTTPRAQPLPADPRTACDAAAPSEPVPFTLGDAAPDGANCIPVLASAGVSSTDLTQAWLGSAPAGRLQRTCGRGNTGRITGLTGVDPAADFDTTDLFTASDGLLGPGADTSALRDRIRAGLAPDARTQGAVTAEALSCPRLLLVPVLAAPPPVGVDVRHAVVGFTYFWVGDDVTRNSGDEALRGFMIDSSQRVVGLRGWVVDPGYIAGGDWISHAEPPDDALPYRVPRRAVLARAPCDDHPDTLPCPP